MDEFGIGIECTPALTSMPVLWSERCRCHATKMASLLSGSSKKHVWHSTWRRISSSRNASVLCGRYFFFCLLLRNRTHLRWARTAYVTTAFKTKGRLTINVPVKSKTLDVYYILKNPRPELTLDGATSAFFNIIHHTYVYFRSRWDQVVSRAEYIHEHFCIFSKFR